MITSARVYVDTITLLSWGSLSKQLLQTVRRLQGKPLNIDEVPVYGRTGQFLGYWFFTSIHQPTTDTINFLGPMQGAKFALNAVHIAFDFLLPDLCKASETRDYLVRSLRLKWRRCEAFGSDQNTDYWRIDSKASRNIAIYCDKPSKTGRGPCCHLEFRFTGAQACRRAGLADLRALCGGSIDPFSILNRQAKIAYVDGTRLDRAIEDMARQMLSKTKKRHPIVMLNGAKTALTTAVLEIKIHQLLARCFGNGPISNLHLVRSQDLWDSGRHSLRRALVELSWDQFTPPPEWHLWR
jgi:hypothetical protein